jgi:acyl-CoA dehydrogenase
MMYVAPVSDIAFVMEHVAEWRRDLNAAGDLSAADVSSILEEAGRFVQDVIAPLNHPSDTAPTSWENGVVRTPTGWRDAYQAWTAAGWNGVSLPVEHGGMGLPTILGAATMEMLTSACMALATLPVLTQGAIEALEVHADPQLRETYLPKLVAGEWTATMNLTEPQAGSDLAAVRTRAEPGADGTYRIRGQKIFITFGEHDLADNIVHLVLARLPDAPVGTRGISLFLVPKFLLRPDGTLGARNDVRCAGIEHKVGIKASPTCTMVFGENDGAIGWLVGEPHRGLVCMFTMMNKARLATGLQGVAIAERAFQQALRYARERRQGRKPGFDGAVPIIEHPDVARNLLTMRALTDGARAITYFAAAEIDRAQSAQDPVVRKAAQRRADLLTPVVKAFASDIGVEVASLGIQIHGGMGFVEETGAAQYWRDARIAPIYEGTNGIQAIDLVTRKIARDTGANVLVLIAEARETVAALHAQADPRLGGMAVRLGEAVSAWEDATHWLVSESRTSEELYAIATPYLRLFGISFAGILLARGALATLTTEREQEDRTMASDARLATARFYAETVAIAAVGLALSVTGSAAAVAAGRVFLEAAAG